MAFKAGNNAKVTLGANTVVGMGTWELTGITTDLLDASAFGDVAKQWLTGMLDYGGVNFSGLYDPADSTGQAILLSANINNSKIANIRLYVDANSYWTPNVTQVSAAGMLVQSTAISIEKSGLAQIRFTAKATGPWLLV